jgi:hypothetical protein
MQFGLLVPVLPDTFHTILFKFRRHLQGFMITQGDGGVEAKQVVVESVTSDRRTQFRTVWAFHGMISIRGHFRTCGHI